VAGSERFNEAIVFTTTPWSTISNGKYSMVQEASILAIEAPNRQWALPGAPAGTPSVYQIPSSPSLPIDSEIQEAVSLQFCSMVFFQIYNIYYAPNYTLLKLNISTIGGRLANGESQTIASSDYSDLCSQTELQSHVMELLFDDAYLSKDVDDKKSWFT
jgi:hypothetical protein